MRQRSVITFGKIIRWLAQKRGGSGSALPGLFVEKIDASFIPRTLSQLPQGVAIISGTNGKTTTTKMVVELLEGQGLKVFTNRTGSNFTRGVAAALLGEVDNNGKLNADIAILELDEAHAVHFVKTVTPHYSLLLNVMRDQLDRFGEIDTTAKLLKQIADSTTKKIVINREDPRLLKLAASLPSEKVSFFGLDSQLRQTFPTDDDMRSSNVKIPANYPTAIATLEKFEGKHASFSVNNRHLSTDLKLEGIYNVYNAAAALGLVVSIVPTYDPQKLTSTLADITPAFGRGETIQFNNQTVELVLVKNPAGFRLALKSFPPEEYSTMIAINDNYADGRDMSWLWDVDFESLKPHGVSMISGKRAYDMATRLQYDLVPIGSVDTNITTALRALLDQPDSSLKRIYCTYTAMLAIRRELSKVTDVKAVI